MENIIAMNSADKTENHINIKPLVTIIMGVYNGESTLNQSISSILDQTYDNFEFIICDDASSDNTWKCLEKWKARDDRIILLKNKVNLGAGLARNKCLELAKGKYVALMDADDISMPKRIMEQVNFMENFSEFGFVGTKGEYFTREIGDLKQYYWFLAKPCKEDFLMTLPFVHASLMFRIDIFRELGGYRDSWTVKRSEDYDLLLRAYASGVCGANINEPLYGIRLNRETFQRRKYRYRFLECIVKWNGFYHLGLMPLGIAYAVKPLIVGLIPVGFLNRWKSIYYSRKGE